MATRIEVLAPPEERQTAWQWAQHNLFGGLWNSLLTVVIAAALASAVSRIAGWGAHVIEQQDHNRLIRPRALYTGPPPQTYVPLAQRT